MSLSFEAMLGGRPIIELVERYLRCRHRSDLGNKGRENGRNVVRLDCVPNCLAGAGVQR